MAKKKTKTPETTWSWPDNPMPEDVLSAAVVADSGRCPYCLSDDIEAGPTEADEVVTCEVVCNKCEAVWTEVYTLIGASHT